MVYDVNVVQISPKMGIQLLDFLSKLGYYKTEGDDDFECTTSMIDFIAENINAGISILTTFEKVDLGIALMIIPISPALELANKCLENVSERDFKVTCLDLAASTEYFEKYKNTEIQFIDESNLAIGIIQRYLRPITGKMENAEKEFRKKFQEITKHILIMTYNDMYGSGSSKSADSDTNLPWTLKCTPSIIDVIAGKIKSERSTLTTFEKVDLAIALMIIQIPPALELANECLENISETDFKIACHDLIILTDYFEKYNEIEFINLSKFRQITQQISNDIYPWLSTNIELTTCGTKGPFGPSLEDCISTYNSDWSKNKKLFDVDSNRKGIQKIRIVKNGSYEIKAWGAGNYQKTGSGNGFRINY